MRKAVPELEAAIFANRCEDSGFVGTPFNIDDFIVDIKALEGVKRGVFSPVP